jgi:hypothetical protein
MILVKKGDKLELRREGERKKVGELIYSELREGYFFIGDCVLDLNDIRDIEKFILELTIKGKQ